MHKLLAATFLALGLSVAGAGSVFAQDAGGGTGASDGGSDKGGTTGAMTTTPEAKTDDTAGTRGGSTPTVATPGGLETGAPHGCTATQMWDPAKMECVEP